MNLQKKLLLQTLSLFFLLSSSSTFTMLHRRYKKQIEQAEALKKIKEITSIAEIDARIESIKQTPYEECLKELSQITGIPYDILKIKIDIERILVEEVLKEENPAAHHDPTMPPVLYENLRETFLDLGLNPKSTTFTYEKNSKTVQQNAASHGIIFYGTHALNTPEILQYEKLLRKPEAAQLFIDGHELHHILLQHNAMRFLALSHKPAADLKQLTSIYEREADINTASRNSKLACVGAAHRCKRPHAQILDGKKHCAEMVIVCALMQQKEMLLLK